MVGETRIELVPCVFHRRDVCLRVVTKLCNLSYNPGRVPDHHVEAVCIVMIML